MKGFFIEVLICEEDFYKLIEIIDDTLIESDKLATSPIKDIKIYQPHNLVFFHTDTMYNQIPIVKGLIKRFVLFGFKKRLKKEGLNIKFVSVDSIDAFLKLVG